MSTLFIFTENFARGGGNKYLIDLVNALSLNVDSVIVASNHNGFYPEEKRQFNARVRFGNLYFLTAPRLLNWLGLLSSRHFFVNLIRLVFLVLDPVLMLFNILLFCIMLLRKKPEQVLCANGGYPASRACIAMVLAARIVSIPVSLSIVSMPVSRRYFMSWYEMLLDRLVWSSVNVVVVNADAIARQLHALREMPVEKAVVVYNGLPPAEPSPQTPSSDQALVIGCVARMDAAKGVFNLLEAFRQLLKNHPQLRLVLVGAGDGSTSLAKLVAEHGLTNSVTLAGHYSGDVSQLLSQFDIFAFPSLWEGFPYSILEAMRAGLPIISTNVGGIPEAITDGVEGLLVSPGSVNELTNGLERLIKDQQLRVSLATHARHRFETDFTLEQMASRVKRIF